MRPRALPRLAAALWAVACALIIVGSLAALIVYLAFA